MSLTTFAFALLCFTTIIIYFVVPKKFQWIILLISSVIFLFYDNLHISTIIQALLILIPTYILGRKIEENYNTKKAKKFLIIGIIIILGQLVYLKYTNLFLATANHICNLFKIDYQFEFVYRNSLIGLSYYSLIMISYLVDIYRGVSKAQNNVFKSSLFMSYFPILTSGPFIRYKDIQKDLYGSHKFNYENLCYGLIRVFWGLFKILVISQRLGTFVDTVYSDLTNYNGIFVLIAMVFFTIQLYTNFSGSIDVIMGISRIFGISLPENFNLPFFSKTITEFWRNWHITLGLWLKDYIFYPLLKSEFMQNLNKKCKKRFGKNIGKKIPLYISMLIMWVLIGIWHGGAYTYIIGSGILQFIFVFLEDMLTPLAKKINNKLHINMNSFGYKLYQCIRTFTLFSFAMIFFRASSVNNALQIIKNMFVWNPQSIINVELVKSIGLDLGDYVAILLSIIVLFIVSLLSRKKDLIKEILNKKLIIRWAIIYCLILSVIFMGEYGVGYNPAAFIYGEF